RRRLVGVGGLLGTWVVLATLLVVRGGVRLLGGRCGFVGAVRRVAPGARGRSSSVRVARGRTRRGRGGPATPPCGVRGCHGAGGPGRATAVAGSGGGAGRGGRRLRRRRGWRGGRLARHGGGRDARRRLRALRTERPALDRAPVREAAPRCADGGELPAATGRGVPVRPRVRGGVPPRALGRRRHTSDA